MITHRQLRDLFAKFWQERDHQEVPPTSLVPQNDATTLFTGSGMQPLVPYLLGEPHPLGNRLYNIQPCFRSQDIDEVGDNRHTTFFEMIGNWSLGDYFKKEQLSWFWYFLTEVLQLPKERLYVTVFAGDEKNRLPSDEESIDIWKKLGVESSHIFRYGSEKNWWSRAGTPEQMPINEPGGGDSEVFFEFVQVAHNPKFGKNCHPNCDCGRFLEIGNSVFMEYKKTKNGFEKLSKKNVDFGGGLERMLAALNNNPDVFQTDLYLPIIDAIVKIVNQPYQEEAKKRKIRVIADHLKAAAFLIKSDVYPSNKERGYVLRRLLRRTAVKMFQLKGQMVDGQDLFSVIESVINLYQRIYFEKKDFERAKEVITEEINRFNKTLNKGLKILEKLDQPTGKDIFDLYQSFGFPKEISEEVLKEKGIFFDKKQFDKEFEKHRQLSRTTSVGIFKGGLADNSEKTVCYHTATHLIHQALFDILGEAIRQEGSQINQERLRFDFYCPYKPNQDQLKKVEEKVNQKIKEELPVFFKIMPKEEAYKIKAKSFFKDKYGSIVKVYFIGDYSKEFCGGPHVKNTKEIGKISIFKFEKIGSNLYRLYGR